MTTEIKPCTWKIGEQEIPTVVSDLKHLRRPLTLPVVR